MAEHATASCSWCARGYVHAPMQFYPDAHVGPPLSPAALAQMNADLCGGCGVAPGQTHMPDCGANEFTEVEPAECPRCYGTGALPSFDPLDADSLVYCECPVGVGRQALDTAPEEPEPYFPWG